ncbi:hypothetical protein PQJ75_19900 [Rhodoplanes sp. TEM]|uniref:Uncharacterized protein n=1 Tax=Rhodoplanes tepidamans TaxID=200616 RepID=A0ABT5JBE8_RHOTP|nr:MULTISPECIES: hypothetical protein [Rhodoplanes]MDC7786802.1 hypothetical protein [Rhodoplanes tepidamans]MDC7985998.1 hypothetical protein [Rhodoplanes sp. TEM]MDQ0355929.1 hypothetical protein [Rhodoplanes tepidamans]
MRTPVLALAILAATLAMGGVAAAKKINLTATVTQVRIACSKVGGQFGVHMDGGGYGCVKENCNGKGGKCIIACDNNNNCVGTYPGRAVAGNPVVGVLNDTRAPAGKHAPPGGGILDAGPGFSPQAPAATGTPLPPPPAPPTGGGVIY